MLNVGGFMPAGQNFDVEQLIEKYPDSTIEIFLSERHKMDQVNGIPTVDRDAEAFFWMATILLENYDINLTNTFTNKYIQEELDFYCIEAPLSELMLNHVFRGSPVCSKEGHPPFFQPANLKPDNYEVRRPNK